MEEIWVEVPGFSGTYSVSSLGRLRREAGRTSNGRNWAEKILQPRVNREGYHRYTLYRDGKPHYRVVHRLVCEAFHGPPPPGKSLALHRDDDRNNNSPGNLYWGDLSDNQRDVIRNGNSYGRNKTHCVNGHEYTEENTYLNPKTGHRACQTCRLRYTQIQNEKRRTERNTKNGNI